MLLQWLWQQPTWQAAACTHCSLLFVHCQGKGAGGRTEGEEGTGNYKNRQKKSNHSRDCSWGLERRTLVACRHRPCLPTINIYTPAAERHIARQASSAVPTAAGRAGTPALPPTRTFLGHQGEPRPGLHFPLGAEQRLGCRLISPGSCVSVKPPASYVYVGQEPKNKAE